VIPLARERLLISGGVGLAMLVSGESAHSTSGEKVNCGTCEFMSGSGPTEVIEFAYFPDKERRNLGVTFNVRNVQINSSGLTPVSNSFGTFKYKDSFTMFGGGITFRFGLHR
jgi:hypothetical protein